MTKFSILFFLLILFGCASGNKTHFSEQKLADLVESFDLNKDEFAKFRTEPAQEIQVVEEVIRPAVEIEEEEDEQKEKKVVEVKSTTPVLNPAPKKKADKKIKSKKVAQVKPAKPEEVVEVEEKLPEGYPDFLKKLNNRSEDVWKTHRPKVEIGEKFVFEITYLGITVGHVQMINKGVVKVANKNAFHFHGRLKSSKYYEMLYSLDDTVDSYIDIDSFLPIKYSLRQRESGKDVDDLQLYDQETLKTYAWYKRVKKGQIKKWEKSAFIPKHFQDMLSIMYFARGLKFEKGAKYEIPIVTRGKIYKAVVKYKGLDDVKAMDRWWKAHLITAEIVAPKKKEKKGKVLFWLTPNTKRRFLKFEADFKISFTGELVEYVPGKPYEGH